MRVDGFVGADVSSAKLRGQELEGLGYDAGWSIETSHDPFLPLVLAAEHTETLGLGTSIAVAFARTPMVLANIGWDLNNYSGGRFTLGLGSQIKPHVEKRFSMEWSKPAARMREFVQALHAIWSAWSQECRLDFRGEFYTHTLMTPMFSPGPNEHGAPKVFLAGVGELMTEVAGEVADGFFCHSFTTEQYLREVTMPALQRGLDTSGRHRDALEVCGPAFVVTGEDEHAMAESAEAVKAQIAFYGSTPAYRPVLEMHGWGELQVELNTLSKQGRWSEMADLVDDEILATFAVVAEPEDIPRRLAERYGDVVDRINLAVPPSGDRARWATVIEELGAV